MSSIRIPISQPMQLGKVLKRLLTESDLKTTQLSRATNVPVQTLHNWLAGQKPRDVSQVRAVAAFFNVTLDYLLFDSKPLPVFQQYEEELNAGVYEVVLRKVRK